jgi:hypothetical protein
MPGDRDRPGTEKVNPHTIQPEAFEEYIRLYSNPAMMSASFEY